MNALGAIFSKYDSRDIRYSDHRNPAGPVGIIVPSIFGHGKTFTDWGMLGNEKYGDCVWAGSDHEVMLIDNLASGGETGYEAVKFTDSNALSDYASTGFNPQTGEGDNGTEVRAALDYRVKTGTIDATGKRHKIAAYVALELKNIAQLAEATFVFDAVGIGFEFPNSAGEQFNSGVPWSVVKGAQIEGGHYVPIVGKPYAGALACITWGKRQVLTEQFYKTYTQEAWAYITEESLNKKTEKNWGGFNWAQLNEQLKSI
jgi:hypothetical protein